MSLREIVKRFVRRESLPVSKEGHYEERFGDLEKLKHADITVQMERIQELKAQIAKWNERVKKAEADRAAAEAEKQKADALKTSIESLSPEKGNTAQKSTPIGA